MEIKKTNLESVAAIPSQYPKTEMPEIVFVGRSNVGKSSLINALMNRKSLARVSSSPGKTRTINFYNIDDKAYFVDLPGYGYAKAPKSEKENWGKMIETYLKNRIEIKLIVQLMDIRHSPSNMDIQMFDWLMHYNYPMIAILTKMDKINRSQLQKHIKNIKNKLSNTKKIELFPFSAQTKQGKEGILKKFEEFL